jgi:hypothetical protein
LLCLCVFCCVCVCFVVFVCVLLCLCVFCCVCLFVCLFKIYHEQAKKKETKDVPEINLLALRSLRKDSIKNKINKGKKIKQT